MRTEEIRQTYLDYFRELDHRVFPSASLVPQNDPTIMFTVAGMVQFKDQLIGAETPTVRRAASCQLCLRAGGKHNDLENVGYTARHHTLFEMLGNFSFGDYFKEEAIDWAWKFVMDVLRFDRDQIWISVHPTDDVARDIWTRKIGIKEDRVVDHVDNFWEMGETGPCGPNTEIFIDQGPELEGGPPGSPNEDGDRFLEFWNLVFPQFDRQPDGELEPLSAPGIDTGLGLERTAALLQGVRSNYETDQFWHLIQATAEFANIQSADRIRQEPSLRVIADHIRSCAFLISDGVLPSNEGRGYVLRRIIRRALRHGYKLGIHETFFHSLVKPLAESMGETYSSLTENLDHISTSLRREEEKFANTLRHGMVLLENEIKGLSGTTVGGAIAFKLYDTYGFPVDLTEDVARERGLTVDLDGFHELMEIQRTRARAASQFDAKQDDKLRFDSSVEFEGYDSLSVDSMITDTFTTSDGTPEPVDSLNEGEAGILVLDRTGFYGEAGGQIGDTGEISTPSATFQVRDTQRMDRQFLHYGEVTRGVLGKGDAVATQVDSIRRQDIARNHTATHLLHAALKEVLGPHVQQRGSLVAPDRLRFDFSHDQALTQEEIEALEDLVNEQIALNSKVVTEVMPYEQAIARGAVAMFGEKYDDFVRVLNVGNGFSVELCGGTHVPYVGEIGSLKIYSETSIAAGTRRVEAVTGREAQARARTNERTLQELARVFQTQTSDLPSRVQSLIEEKAELQQQIRSLSQQSHADVSTELVASASEVNGVSVVSAQVNGDAKEMMSIYDEIASKLPSRVVVLSIELSGKIQLVCGVSKDLGDKLRADELVKFVGAQVGARGGGTAELARAGGGTDSSALSDALRSVETWVAERTT
ncbi:MAG: alanine--tRNA ligase [Gammaproteobacteria bacterium]|nr:alanine--tRNA ligase [Gammaproteobacteria bacterium]MYF38285.1 alanine--tRNA ligase [Gammaproteobacteria bacterium]